MAGHHIRPENGTRPVGAIDSRVLDRPAERPKAQASSIDVLISVKHEEWRRLIWLLLSS